jgi:hypothetical protein
MSETLKSPVDAPSGWQVMKMMEIALQQLSALPEKPDEMDPETDAAQLMEVLKGAGANVPKIMQALLLAGDEARHEAAMIEEREKNLTERRRRRLRKAEACRNAVLNIMIELPELFPGGKFRSTVADARVQGGRQGAQVIDEKKIPDRFWIQPPKVIDKKALNDAMVTDGEVIEGAELRNGAPFLVVKVS